MIPQWQDWPGFDFIFFDCDSTLSAIEGIDELARQKGKFNEVKKLTDAAMDGEVHLQSVYDYRLQLLNPTRSEIKELVQSYREAVVPDAEGVISALQFLGKEVFIISGGLLAAVRPFGVGLGIPAQNIRAVDVHYNNLSGQWWDYQQDLWGQRPDVNYMNPEITPLIETQGKTQVIRELLGDHPRRAMLIGDGVSDLVARSVVDLLVGFGGVISRQRVAHEADVFIKVNSLAPVLPLALSHQEHAKLINPTHQAILQKGLSMMAGNEVFFNKSF